MKGDKTYFVISDIHSFYDAMLTGLSNAGFDVSNPDHILIVCGDLLDRGENPVKVLDYLERLHSLGRCILIRGNHEQLFLDLEKRKYTTDVDIRNGTANTVMSLKWNSPEKWGKQGFLMQWIRKNFVDYYDLGNMIMCHSWVPLVKYDCYRDYGVLDYSSFRVVPDYRSAAHSDWQHAAWVNPVAALKANLVVAGKTIVGGHWHTSGFRRHASQNDEFDANADFSIFKDPNGRYIGIDGCIAAHPEDPINVLVLNGKGEVIR